MSPWQVITICTILLRRAAQICPPICLRGTVSQFLHSHNPFKIPACGGLFSPLWEKFSPKSCLWEKFLPDTPHPRRGASVELSEGESDPSQTYVSPFRIPVSPMGGVRIRRFSKCRIFVEKFQKNAFLGSNYIFQTCFSSM